jgi:cytochrome c nitrite reductase small subunit
MRPLPRPARRYALAPERRPASETVPETEITGSMKSDRLPLVVLAVLVGLAIGIGAYTFIYAKGGSYFTDDPAACANCHVMSEHYSSWTKSSHRSVAACNDCHTPPGFIAKYATKASNGFWHSFAFTTGKFPDPLRIKPSNYEVTEKACRKCHAEIVEAIEAPAPSARAPASMHEAEETSCIRCHNTVGHWVR